MARVAVGFLLLWFSVYGCMRGLGQARECASGFIDQETLTIGLQVRSRIQEQRIIPQLNFTCNGSLTRWIFAASWNGGTGHDLYPDLQIWRPNGSGTYMKVQNSTVNITARNITNRYEYIPNPPLEFQAGDIIGIFQPSQARGRLYMQYYQGNIYSKLINYYYQTLSQFQNFSTSGQGVRSEYILPLITAEMEINSQSTEISLCSSGFLSEEALTRLTVLIAQSNRVQRIIPSLRFDCDGAITKWIVGASWRNTASATSFPDLQIWRNSSENRVYTKVGNTTLIATSSNSSQLYEFPVEPSLPFQRGDILGIFQPSSSRSRLRIYYRIGSGNPLNFVFRPNESVIEPPLETFTTSSSSIIRQTVLPLVTMEISRSTPAVTLPLLTATASASLSPTSTTSSLPRTPAISLRSLSTPASSLLLGTSAILHTSSISRSTSAVTLPLLTATASASLSPTSTTFTLLRTPAVLHTSTADILPTIFPQPFSYTNTFSTSDTTSNYPATSNTIETSSPTTPSTLLPPIMQPSDDVQSSLPVPITITIGTVIPSALVILTIVCTILIILIARWRIAKLKGASKNTTLEHFEMSTNDAYISNAAAITTTGNIAYMTVGDTITAKQNVAYAQVPPGTDECYDYVIT